MPAAVIAEEFATSGSLLQRTEVWLVRHGESVGNAEGKLQGQQDYPLSERGRRQAAALADRLRDHDFAALYSSDLTRARDTALTVSAALGRPLAIDARLREIDIGIWSGLTPDEIAERHPADWAAWCARRDPLYRRGGGESYVDLQRRIAPTMHELAQRHPGARILVVAHGGTICAYLAWVLGMPLDGLWRISQDNACINRIQPFHNPNTGEGIAAGRILCLNDTLHLAGI